MRYHQPGMTTANTFRATGRPTIHYRPRCAYICINGKAFRLIYSPSRIIHDVTPSDARLIPLDAMDRTVRVEFTHYNEESGQEEPAVIRLHFLRSFKVNSIFNLARTTMHAVRSNHSSAVQQRRRAIPLQESRMVRPAQDDQDACYICMENAPNAKFPSCEHAELCCACAYQITQSSRRCPLCRGAVTSFERIH